MTINQCLRGRWITLICGDFVCGFQIPMRCPVSNLCPPCGKQRRSVITAKILQRHNMTTYQIPPQLNLWTLGTSLHQSGEDSMKLIAQYWKYFRMRMNLKKAWKPLFRVVESGSKSGYLHIHFINNGYLDHSFVMKIWRDITKEPGNVNYSKKSIDPKLAIFYLTKYLTKSMAKYSVLGEWRKQKLPEFPKRVCKEHELPYEYYVSIEGWYGANQQSLDDHMDEV